MQKYKKGDPKAVFFVTVLLTYLLPVVFFWLAADLPHGKHFKYWFTIWGSIATFTIALLAIRKDTVGMETIGWTTKHLKQALKIILIGWAIWAVIIISVNHKMGYPFHENFETSPKTLFQQWLFVGLAEELLFRGYIFTKLRQFFANRGAFWANTLGMIVSSLIFATFHIPQRIFVEGIRLGSSEMAMNFLGVFLVGMVLAWMFLRTRNVILVGLVHGGMNAPLIGRRGDLAPLILFLIIIEVAHWLEKRHHEPMGLADQQGRNTFR